MVSVVGAHFEPDFPLDNGRMFAKELTMRWSIGDSLVHRERLIEMISAGRLDPPAVVTHRMELADAGEAYRLFDSREATKIVMTSVSSQCGGGRRGACPSHRLWRQRRHEPAEVKEALEARLVGKKLSFESVYCLRTQRSFEDRTIFRCNVNFGEPHIVIYCAVVDEGGSVTNRAAAGNPLRPHCASVKPTRSNRKSARVIIHGAWPTTSSSTRGWQRSTTRCNPTRSDLDVYAAIAEELAARLSSMSAVGRARSRCCWPTGVWT